MRKDPSLPRGLRGFLNHYIPSYQARRRKEKPRVSRRLIGRKQKKKLVARNEFDNGKVKDNELMIKLRERMKLAEKQEDEREKKKTKAQKKTEEDRRMKTGSRWLGTRMSRRC